MIRKLLGLSCAVLLSSSALAVELSSKFYGEVNISYDFVDTGKDDFLSNVSRLGLKGDYKISDSLKVIYQVEQEVDLLHGGDEIDELLSMRNTFIGLQGNFGKVFFGAHDSPTKRVKGKADLFNDQAGDIKTLLVGEVRTRDSFFYHSPKWNGLQLQSVYVPEDNVFDSSQSLAVSWEQDDLYLAFGVDADLRKNERAVAKTSVYDSYVFTAQYTPGNWKFGGIVQRSEQQNAIAATSELGYVLSLGYKWNKFNFTTQYGDSDIPKADSTAYNFGVDYKIAAKGKVYLYYWNFDNGVESDTLSLGVEYKF